MKYIQLLVTVFINCEKTKQVEGEGGRGKGEGEGEGEGEGGRGKGEEVLPIDTFRMRHKK